MKKNRKLPLVLILFVAFAVHSQSVDSLKSQMKQKKDSIKKLETELCDIKNKIASLPGWKFGVFGTVGANFSGFNNWYQQANSSSSSANIGIIVNGFANLNEQKYFWRNSARMNLGWIKFDDKNDPNDDKKFKSSTDILNLSSLYGRRLSKQWAASAMLEYRTSVIDNFNNPGYLDLGVGASWMPFENLIAVIHPLNYNIVFSKSNTSYKSSLGTKVVVDYMRMLPGGINLKSNFTAFVSYKGSEFSNWTWTNNLTYTFWRGIGIGLETGLRKNKQEFVNNYMVANSVSYKQALKKDNKLQSFWLLGISFAL